MGSSYTLFDDVRVIFKRIEEIRDEGYQSEFERQVFERLIEELRSLDFEAFEDIYDMHDEDYVALALGRMLLYDLLFGQERLVALLLSIFAQFNRLNRGQPYATDFIDGMHTYFTEVK